MDIESIIGHRFVLNDCYDEMGFCTKNFGR